MWGGDESTVDIVFSHNQRMRCVLDSTREPGDEKAPQPKNGGIAIIFEIAKGRFKSFYDPTQFKKDAVLDDAQDTTFIKHLRKWLLENPYRTKAYVYVRHGEGWHNVHKGWWGLQKAASSAGKDSRLEQKGEEDARRGGMLLGQILAELDTPVQAIFCSDLQRTGETAQIAICSARAELVKAESEQLLLGSDTAPSPNRIIVLPCNHELPKGQCGAWAGLSAGSLSSENETSLPARQPMGFSGAGAEGGTVWGHGSDRLEEGNCAIDNRLAYDYSAYYKFYAGGPRGPSGARNVNISRLKCRNKPFPENIIWTLANLTVPVSTAPNATPVDEDAPHWVDATEGKWTGGGRRRKSRRKIKRRRVRVTLCKKRSFHKCNSRKHRKKRS
jgi:broad specificity phosphatase PhoE